MSGENSDAMASPQAILEALDADQRAAVLAPAGPVCILAGAGTGKTRAITHRIAYRVLTGETVPTHVLAVTFTARAAGEMRGRLRTLGVQGVQARTFHAAALRQLRFFAPRVFEGRAMPTIMESKARMVGHAAAGLRFTLDKSGVRDATSEIEWAKSSLIEPDDYPATAAKAGRGTPLSADQLAVLYSAYEQAKRRAGVIDFEDMLRATAWAIEEHRDVAEQIRAQYRHFVVDEYQDVSPLQQRLLTAWLGRRSDVCVVGDASQTIYSFTGATSDFLLDFGRTFPRSAVIRLERDYRSTPQIVTVANQVISAATGREAQARLTLVGQRPAGPQPRCLTFDDESAEAEAVTSRCKELLAAGTPASEIAVLFRTNAQSETYEQALATAGVPYVMKGAERFFERPEIREATVLLRGAARVPHTEPLAETVRQTLAVAGFQADSPPAGGVSRERWEALAALVRLADEFAVHGARAHASGSASEPRGDGETALAAFVAELVERAAAQHAPTVEGVTIASLHAAKGLEWDAVFLVGLTEGMLPITYATTPAQLEEERRLFYVGITRAREYLWLSWAAARTAGGRANRKPSRFLPHTIGGSGSPALAKNTAQSRRNGPAGSHSGQSRRSLPVCRSCGVALFDPRQRILRRCSACPAQYDEELFERLREWRIKLARHEGVPAYVIFTDATLQAIAEERPTDPDTLITVPGVGPRRLTLYGEAVLALVNGADPAGLMPAGE